MNDVESVNTEDLKRLAVELASGVEQLSTSAQTFISRIDSVTSAGGAPFGRGDAAAAATSAYAGTRDQILQCMQQVRAYMRHHSEALGLAADAYDSADAESTEIAARAATEGRI
jgi:uncharacterized protein YukE